MANRWGGSDDQWEDSDLNLLASRWQKDKNSKRIKKQKRLIGAKIIFNILRMHAKKYSFL